MKITISTLILCLCCVLFASAQTNYSVKGSVSDSTSKVHLVNSTIAVLNAKDSTLRAFTRVAENGSFNIGKLNKGKFILLVTYPEYADYVEPFALDSTNTTHDFKKLYLRLKSRVLQEVMIKGTAAAMKIKGDTTEFDPRAFVIQPNSKVEDLLKQLPGIQVDKDGKITAQGKTVPKVLVDGEEFFGDDPTLVTKNIRGDMVDKIQLYDKKSDQAAFTGIDDGKEVKTINIKLKEDKKNGYFGKLEAGYGTDKYYSGQALFNKFWGKKKLSVYAIGSNTGKTGLGWEDSNKYGNGGNMEVMDDGGIMFFGGGDGGDLDSFDGRYNGQGYPTARTGGLHFDNKWDSDNKTLNTNYKLGYLDIKGNSESENRSTQLGQTLRTNNDQTFSKSVFRQKLDFMHQIKIDTNTTIKFTIDGTLKNSKNNDSYNSAGYRGIDTLINMNKRSVTNDVDNQIFNASVFLTKKLKKKGRTLSVNVNGNINNSEADGYLYSDLRTYLPTGATDSITDQHKLTSSRSNNIYSNVTYTEPITTKLSLVFNYGASYNHNNADRRSFNNVVPGSQQRDGYTVFDTKFSNNYTLNQFTNSGGASLNYRAKNSTLNISAKAANVNFDQTNESANVLPASRKISRNFINWNPSANYQYRFTQQSSFRVNYWGYTEQPSIDQIQPVLNNNDPLNISLGNPNLRPSFRNSFGMYYNSYKIIADQSIWIGGNFGFVNNEIVNDVTQDLNNGGKRTYRSVNLSGKTPINYNLNVDAGQKLKLWGLQTSIELNTNGNTSYNYVNGILNTTKSSNYMAGLRIGKYKQKKYDFNISAGPGYSFGSTSLQPDQNNNGTTFNGYGRFNVYLPLKFQIWSDGNYEHRGKTQSFDQTFDRTLINAGINKTFLKGDNLKMALSVNDLLNQNNGFDRSSSAGNFTQNRYTTIRRYFMFTITWDFSKMGGGVAAAK